MKTAELIHILQKHPDKEVIVRIGNGLFCPVDTVKLFDGNIVIIGKELKLSDECVDFEPLKFEPSVEKLYIIDNKK
jgi:hypothetical protein